MRYNIMYILQRKFMPAISDLTLMNVNYTERSLPFLQNLSRFHVS